MSRTHLISTPHDYMHHDFGSCIAACVAALNMLQGRVFEGKVPRIPHMVTRNERGEA